MGIRNIKLTIQYDGINYHGWQFQPDKRTIEGELTRAICELIGRKIHVCGASRTDAGVSALGQAALIQIDSPIPTKNLARAITDRLPIDITVTEASEVPFGLDIIGGAKRKLYRYTIYTAIARPVLNRHCWHIPDKLNVESMKKAAALLVGTKDFKSFAAADDKRQETVRTLYRVDISSDNDYIFVDVEGNSFLYNMVRNIVGTLVESGVGRMKPEKITEILEAKDRRAAGPIAPPEGLCLIWIKY